jgi:prephenate dehydrogenase
MKRPTLTIVGVGLIGGSIGLAAKRRGLVERVVGVGRRIESLQRARALGAIDEASTDLVSGVAAAQLAVFCTPVDQIAAQVLEAAPRCAPGTLLTDAGSTKGEIVRDLEGKLPAEVHFIGSHPLAGSEKRGPDHADADLFQGRLTIVTRTPQTNADALEQVAAFWRGLGSRVRIMDPSEHDRALALTSHLPHLLASALAGLLPPELSELTATGFRDTTRIAAGDPAIWDGIFLQNRTALVEGLTQLQYRLDEYRTALTRGDRAAIDALLAQAKKVRDALGS